MMRAYCTWMKGVSASVGIVRVCGAVAVLMAVYCRLPVMFKCVRTCAALQLSNEF